MFIERSRVFSKARAMQSTGLALALILAVGAPALAAEPAPEHVCLTAAQAREMIKLHRIAEPFRLMEDAAHRYQGEALRVKLCRRKDEFVYEISLLRHDGRVIHVFINALSGKIVRAINTK
jgi:uncharacterized membrane protein YkoI